MTNRGLVSSSSGLLSGALKLSDPPRLSKTSLSISHWFLLAFSLLNIQTPWPHLSDCNLTEFRFDSGLWHIGESVLTGSFFFACTLSPCCAHITWEQAQSSTGISSPFSLAFLCFNIILRAKRAATCDFKT